MTHRYSFAPLLVALALLTASPSAAQGSPVVANGGFEDSDVGVVTDLAEGVEGWTLEVGGSAAAEFAVVDDMTHTGSRALRVTPTTVGTNTFDIQAIAAPLPVTPGETYTYSVWAKVATAGATVSFTIGNAAFMEYGRLDQQTLTTEWTEYTFTFTVTDQQTEIRAPIHFSYTGNAGGAVFVDDLSIVSMSQPEPDPGADAVNTNGSFEDTDPGPVTDFENGVDGWLLEVGGTAAAEVAVVSGTAFEGDQSLRVTLTRAGSDVFNVQAIATPLPVTPGETYVYSVRARSARAGATVNFTVGNAAFMEYGRLDQQVLTTEWTEYTFQFTVNDQETDIRAPVHFSFAPNVGNAVYIDALSIRSVNSVDAEPSAGRGGLVLEQNRPNPFGTATTIAYTLGAPGDVTLEVFNALGQRVATLVDGAQQAGPHQAQLRAGELAAGVYVYRLRAGSEVQTRRLVVVR